jgi:3-isopropylmalate/(R)-2-methylmalate dehydratase small subunit
MKKESRGRAWIFGDNVDTDCITPGKYENLPFPDLCKHCLEPLNATFAREVAGGDLIIAGENFGCGSAREIAPRALKELKVGAVVAKSFARTFFRNAVAIGLPLLISRDAAEECRPKDVVTLDISSASITNITANTVLSAEPIPRELYLVLSSGGIFPSLKKKRAKLQRTVGRKGGI